MATTDADAWTYGFFVQDPEGGAWSGLFVYLEGVAVDVQRGDVLNLTGGVDEYLELTENIVSSPGDVVVTGSREPAVTEVVGVPEDWEHLEGVLVELNGLRIYGDFELEPRYADDFIE